VAAEGRDLKMPNVTHDASSGDRLLRPVVFVRMRDAQVEEIFASRS
jgi:hypothetical protein